MKGLLSGWFCCFHLFYHLKFCFFVLLIFLMNFTNGSKYTTIDLKENSVIQPELFSNLSYKFIVKELPSSIGSLLFQVHSQRINVSASLTPEFDPGTYLTGHSVGLTTTLEPNTTTTSWYLKIVTGTADKVVKALVLIGVTQYKNGAPLLGGCNMELDLQNDPNLYLTENQAVSKFEFASSGSDYVRARPSDCENKNFQSGLTYHVYQQYLDEGDLSEKDYLNKLKTMMSVEAIMSTSYKISTVLSTKQKKFKAASYPRVGVIYNVIVLQTSSSGETVAAAYTPKVSYGCYPFRNTTDSNSCFSPDFITLKVYTSCLGIIGLILCLAGHIIFKTEMLIFGFLVFHLISFIVISILSKWTFTVILLSSVGFGVLGGVFWLLFWCFIGLAGLSCLFVVYSLGYIITSLIFNVTPLGLLSVWSDDFNYTMAFVGGILLVSLFIFFLEQINIISCAIVGAFLFVCAIDTFIGSTFAFIVINSVRRAAISDFSDALYTIPFQKTEIGLSVAWAVLAIAGLLIQFKFKRPIPECPYQEYKRRRMVGRALLVKTDPVTERTLLLFPRDAAVMSYSGD